MATVRARGVGARVSCSETANGVSSVMRASPMSRRRCFGSRCRVRAIRLRTAGGVRGR